MARVIPFEVLQMLAKFKGKVRSLFQKGQHERFKVWNHWKMCPSSFICPLLTSSWSYPRYERVWNGRTSLSFVWPKEYETVEKVCPLSDHWQHASLLTFQLLWSQVWKCWQSMDTLALSIIYMACNRRPLSPWWPCTCPAIYSNDLLHVFCNLLQPRIMWSCVFSRFSSHCLLPL